MLFRTVSDMRKSHWQWVIIMIYLTQCSKQSTTVGF